MSVKPNIIAIKWFTFDTYLIKNKTHSAALTGTFMLYGEKIIVYNSLSRFEIV